MSSAAEARKLDPNARAFVPAANAPVQQRQQHSGGDARRRGGRKEQAQRAEPRAQTHAPSRKPTKAAMPPANHLLGVQFDHPAQQQRKKQMPRGGKQGSFAARKKRVSKPRSQEQFLQANFAFVVNPYASSWQRGFYDPDELIGWRDIERVSFPTSADSPYQCPVCLETPSVPKITQCGHSFCFTCILRHLDGEISRRCPMCMRDVKRDELRSLIFTHTCTPIVGEPFEFQLLHCIHGTLSPFLPRQDRPRTSVQLLLHDALSTGQQAPKHDDGSSYTAFEVLPTNEDPAARYCRVMVASPETVMEYIYLEQAQLEGLREQSYSGLEDTERLPYIVEALHLLDEKMRQWAAFVSSHKLHDPAEAKPPPLPEPSSPLSATLVEGDAWHEVGEEDLSDAESGRALDSFKLAPEQEVVATESARERPSTSTSDDSGSAGQHDLQQMTSAALGFSFFFQAENGDLIFLHPFNVSCLLTEFEGDVSKFPQRLTGKVVEVEAVRVNDETRRMYSFLSHLPEHCEVMLVEIDLRKVVSQQTLDQHRSEMKRRANRRKVLAKKAAMTAQADADAQEAIKLQHQDFKEHYAEVKRRQHEQIDQLMHGPRVGRAAGDPEAEGEEDEDQNPGEHSGPPLAGWSFSRIIQVGGHFPTLAELSGGGSTQAEMNVGSPSRTTTGAWARPQPGAAGSRPPESLSRSSSLTRTQSADQVAQVSQAAPGSTPESSKAGKKKPKSQPLFSSGGQRSYK